VLTESRKARDETFGAFAVKAGPSVDQRGVVEL
jgi:hypothetical protein